MQVLSMVKEVSPHISAPIILFIYFNPIKARTPVKLCQQAKAAGVSGESLTSLSTTAWVCMTES